jgi:hypothetical protein
MSITVVRQASVVDSSSNVASPAFTGTPTVGNDIIPTLISFNGAAAPTITSIVDNASGGSNSYSTQKLQDNGLDDTSVVSRAEVARTLSNLSVTITLNSGSVLCASAIEVSGLGATPLDVAVGLGTDITSPFTLATGTLAQADELIVGVFTFQATGLGNHGIAIEQWSGVSPTTIFVNDGGGINSEYGAAGYRIVSSTSSVTTSFSSTSNPNSTGSPIAVATFKGDTTAPVLSSPTGTATGSSTANVGATTDEGNGTMYAVVTTSSTQPSVAQIKAGQDHTGAAATWAGNQAISSTGAKTLGATGLTASTNYWGHVVHTDAATNDSNRVSSSQFTTFGDWNTTGTGPRSVPLAGAGPSGAGSFGSFLRGTNPLAGGTTQFKYWTGAAWTAKPLKVWNGTAWVTKPLKRWNGSAWV